MTECVNRREAKEKGEKGKRRKIDEKRNEQRERTRRRERENMDRKYIGVKNGNKEGAKN
jgi:hypothetical protein